MKVVIDLDLCQGHGMCEDAAPEVFRIVETEDGSYRHAELILAEPDSGLREKIDEAVRYCPNRALALR